MKASHELWKSQLAGKIPAQLAEEIDTFETEPYKGKLLGLRNAYLTPHMGSCTTRSRLAMELGAAEEAMNLIHKREFINRIG